MESHAAEISTHCLRNPPIFPGAFLPEERHSDEITPIIRFIVAEMNTNAQSADVKEMAELNRFSYEACITDFYELPFWRQLLVVCKLTIDGYSCFRLIQKSWFYR